jgi:hypothetical protein
MVAHCHCDNGRLPNSLVKRPAHGYEDETCPVCSGDEYYYIVCEACRGKGRLRAADAQSSKILELQAAYDADRMSEQAELDERWAEFESRQSAEQNAGDEALRVEVLQCNRKAGGRCWRCGERLGILDKVCGRSCHKDCEPNYLE